MISFKFNIGIKVPSCPTGLEKHLRLPNGSEAGRPSLTHPSSWDASTFPTFSDISPPVLTVVLLQRFRLNVKKVTI